MGLMARLKAMNVELNNLEDLLVAQLQACYELENQLIQALPEMADAASSPDLKNAFSQHLETTRRQKGRLEQIFHELGRTPHEMGSAPASIVEDAQVLMKASANDDVRDAAMIAAAQQAEHAEIACYGSARTFAQQLGHVRAADLLQQTLDEEGEADKRLTQIAVSHVNAEAKRPQSSR